LGLLLLKKKKIKIPEKIKKIFLENFEKIFFLKESERDLKINKSYKTLPEGSSPYSQVPHKFKFEP